jgi:hypothetical protein
VKKGWKRGGKEVEKRFESGNEGKRIPAIIAQ